MKIKKLLVMALALACIATITITATLAYFTDTDAVTNTFTIGKVGITLDEAKTDDTGYGLAIAGADRVKANTYKAIPAHTYVKDPTVTIDAGSEAAYIRMLVTVNNMEVFYEACPNDFADYGNGDVFKLEKYVTGWDKAKWPCTKAVANYDEGYAVYEFRYYTTPDTVGKSDLKLEPLFTHITMPGVLNNVQIAELADLQIDVVAQAIQADGFADADKAWAAFEAQAEAEQDDEADFGGENHAPIQKF